MAEGESGSASGAGEGRCATEALDEPTRVLRTKYRDYCSARVADVLLTLSPDEIYTLAEAEARRSPEERPTSYTHAVDLATKRVREQLQLPEDERVLSVPELDAKQRMPKP